MNKKNTSNSSEKSITVSGWQDYELLDSGNSRKLERFGETLISRFEPQALWKPALPLSRWQQSMADFEIRKGSRTGRWNVRDDFPKDWQITYKGILFQLRVQQSRHIGIFPEQCTGWDWIENKIQSAGRPIHVLNLFAYTGAATLFAARAGAEVTHVDASRSAVKWAQSNQAISGLGDKPIRWIVDDALKFVQREIRRGVNYDAIILDPPRFGRGPKGEVWKFETSIPELLASCEDILSEHPAFIYMTAYDVPSFPRDLAEWLGILSKPYSGQIDYGKLIQQEKSAGRKINQAMYARWSSVQP